MDKRLYRSNTNKVIGGVCGGLGEYFELDPVLIRILAVLSVFAYMTGLLAYIVAWIIMPVRPLDEPAPEPRYKGSSWNKYLPGIILIAIGVILLMRIYSYYFDWGAFWAVMIILIGLALIFIKGRGRSSYHEPKSNQQDSNNNQGGHIS